MTPKQKVIAMATKLGATIYKNQKHDHFTVEVDSPGGKKFIGSGTHMMVCFDWADALDRMSYGLETCEDDPCDICTEGSEMNEFTDGNPDSNGAWKG